MKIYCISFDNSEDFADSEFYVGEKALADACEAIEPGLVGVGEISLLTEVPITLRKTWSVSVNLGITSVIACIGQPEEWKRIVWKHQPASKSQFQDTYTYTQSPTGVDQRVTGRRFSGYPSESAVLLDAIGWARTQCSRVMLANGKEV